MEAVRGLREEKLRASSSSGASGAATSIYTTCSSCKHEITFGVYFCQNCGGAQLQAMLLPGNKAAGATTKNFDPQNPESKPWRETDHMMNKPVPKMPPKLELKQVKQNPPVVPWRPAMKTMFNGEGPDVKLEKIKKRASLLKSNRRYDEERAQAKEEMEGKDKDKDRDPSIPIVFDEQTGGKSPEKVVYFKQHAFRRRGGKPRFKKVIVKKEKVWDDSKYEKGEQMFIHAVAVYEADWLLAPGFTIHVSLIDRCHDERDKYITRYFLRIGLTYKQKKEKEEGKDDNDEEDEDEEEEVSELLALNLLQNDVGKLLTSPKQYWVDLNLIRPDEYYMASFLQVSLSQSLFLYLYTVGGLCNVEGGGGGGGGGGIRQL